MEAAVKSKKSSRTRREKSPVVIHLLGVLGAMVLRALECTLRWVQEGVTEENRYWAEGSPRIISFWHGHQLLMPWVYLRAYRAGRKKKIFALISHHGDGRIIARAIRSLGLDSVAGSSSRGGAEGLRQLASTLQNGNHAGITPDGPRGPVFEAKAGVIRLAQQTGAPIFPTACWFEKYWAFKSWDRMILPKPFSRAVMLRGEPVYIPSELNEREFEEQRLRVEKIMNDLRKQAEGYFTSQID